jgi:hypothetical protein
VWGAMSQIFRDYRIERDAQGLPVRMVWAGDLVLTAVHVEQCQKCGSSRIRPCGHGRRAEYRCFDCWHAVTMWQWSTR